jgi:murein L,D-transpeptidase YcbB/YkuD
MRTSGIALAALMLACQSTAYSREWSDAQIADLEVAAQTSAEEGLNPPAAALSRMALYRHFYDVDAAFAGGLDSAADNLFHELAAMYARGAVDPAAIGADWHLERPPPPDYAALDAAVDSGAAPSVVLRTLLPQSVEYAALRDELERLRGSDSSDPRQIMQLRANLERWRWMPRALPSRRIEVRIAQFELFLHREGEQPSSHAVIVGAPRTPSPAFGATMISATINPDWTPPASITFHELLPRFQRNPNAAERDGFDVIDGEGRVVDPAQVDWRARPFPYQLRQRPGPDNALGQIRFDLPNPFAVFLHDTPGKRLFARANRALSHGCIRVQNPLALAAAVGESPEWSEAELQRIVDEGAKITLPLPAETPVYVLYLTTALNADGSIAYLDDIYDRDDAVIEALDGASGNANLTAALSPPLGGAGPGRSGAAPGSCATR